MPDPTDALDPPPIPRGAHVFVDESKSRGYILALAFVPPHAVHRLRHALRQLRGPRRRSIHFHGTTDSQRDAVIRLLVEHGVVALIVEAPTAKGNNPRQECIRITARIAILQTARCVVLDRDESLERQDRRWLFEELNKTGIRYDHLNRHDDPLLWSADAIAWCWQRGGAWLDKIRPIVHSVVDIDR